MTLPLILLTSLLFQTQAFKDFDQEAKAAFVKGHYKNALNLFEEAYRIEPKGRHYRVEGTFTDTYIPLYSIALCFEHLDILKASEWANKSKIAQEEELYRKNRKKLAKYHADMKRIIESAQLKLEELDHQFNLALGQAQRHLADNQFNAARRQYEELIKLFPDRPEAQAGIQTVDFAERNFFDSKIQAFQLAITSRQQSAAEMILYDLESRFPERDLSQYKKAINDIKGEKQKEIQLAKQVKKAEKPEPVNRQKVVTNSVNIAEKTAKPLQKPFTESRKQEQKKKVKEHLLAVLNSYKTIGDPDSALDKLSELPEVQLEKYASYYWIKGFLQACSSHQSNNSELLNQSRNNIKKVQKMGFDPVLSDDLYPAFFIEMVKNLEKGG
ncbi:MAG: hypothetical protein CSA81_00930 [Acidobacteria bacterium]|nr:MAG: hypothetical protein CSA81_00930 [Acidobacteriota bacterium]